MMPEELEYKSPLRDAHRDYELHASILPEQVLSPDVKRKKPGKTFMEKIEYGAMTLGLLGALYGYGGIVYNLYEWSNPPQEFANRKSIGENALNFKLPEEERQQAADKLGALVKRDEVYGKRLDDSFYFMDLFLIPLAIGTGLGLKRILNAKIKITFEGPLKLTYKLTYK